MNKINSTMAALGALVICIASAIVASSHSIVGSGFDGIGRAAWITVLVTIPAFAIFSIFSCISLYLWIKKNKN